MRSSHGAIQPPPDSRKPMRIFGCFSQTPPQITARQASIISIVWVMMCRAPRPAKRSMPTCGIPAAARRVVDRAGEQAQARIEKGRVDPVCVHVGDALVRDKAAGLAILVFHRIGRDDALPRPDAADAADAALVVADDMLVHDEALLAVLAGDDAGRPVAEPGVDVLVPEIERLEDVTVGVDDVL